MPTNIKALFATLACCLLPFGGMAQQPTFSQFSDRFADNYQALRLPELELSYVEGFKHIKPAGDVQKQAIFFEQVKAGLKAYNVSQLSPSQKQDYQLIAFETGMNLERLTLEKQWAASKPAEVPAAGILGIPNGKAWYTYLLRRWLSADVTPDQIYQFGLAEVKRVQQHIQTIQKQSGMNEDAFYRYLNKPDFFIADAKVVQDSFERVERIIYSHMDKVFTPHHIPALKIERGSAQALAQTPGYYNADTFYYNLFDKPYNRRQFDWLFIHEAVPGHHYQISIDAAVKKSKVQALFHYIGFAEGWGAYAEELGKDLGVYQTPYAELGKWEWDIVRSVRVPMDIGLNYYGWTDEQALAFWKKNIKNQDDIARREIARVKRWPAQCITYKYGAVQIMQWKQELQQKQGSKFDIRNFHDRVLDRGSLPMFLVRENVMRD